MLLNWKLHFQWNKKSLLCCFVSISLSIRIRKLDQKFWTLHLKLDYTCSKILAHRWKAKTPVVLNISAWLFHQNNFLKIVKIVCFKSKTRVILYSRRFNCFFHFDIQHLLDFFSFFKCLYNRTKIHRLISFVPTFVMLRNMSRYDEMFGLHV